MNHIRIEYGKNFISFLDILSADEVDAINHEIIKFVDGYSKLDVKDCKYFETHKKVAINNIIVLYEIKDKTWYFFEALKNITRVA